MAEKRMFSKSIVESDAFLDMPTSSQALYMHLNMNADDEGFVNSPKKIMRICGCSDDDLKILMMKKFILTFESGVIVIKHWRINNTIRWDRSKESVFQLEKSYLFLKENNSYTFDETKGIPYTFEKKKDGCQMVAKWLPQIREEENIKEYIIKEEINIEYKDILNSLILNFGEDLVEEAIRIAQKRNVNEISYIIGIIKSWSRRGYKTKEDIMNEKNEREKLTCLYEN